MTNILEVEEISKKYNEYYAVSPVTFSLNQAEIAVITGPNGSGKTTLFSCLMGIIPPSSGNVKVAGFDLYQDEVEVHRRMASVLDVPRFYTELTAWEHLEFIASANSMEKEEIESCGKKVFEDISPVKFMTANQLSNPYFDNLKPGSLGVQWKDGVKYQVTGNNMDDLYAVANAHYNDLINTPQGQKYYQ